MDLFRCFALDLDIDVILGPLLTERSTGWLGTSEPILLIVSENQLDPLPGSEKGKADGFIFLSEGKDPGIVIDTCGLKVLDGGVVFQSGLAIGSNPADCSNCQIRRETKFSPNVLIDKTLDTNLVTKLSRRILVNPVASISKSFQSVFYLGCLGVGWIQLALNG